MVKLIKGESDLATLHPDLVKEWHPIKNGDLMPEDISSGSGKEVWWLCPEGHTYSMVVNQRTKRGYGCPYCSGHRAIRGINDLATSNPELSEEWNYEKNNNLTPYDVTAGSHKKVWWLCGKGHPYEQFIIKRANRGYSIAELNAKLLMLEQLRSKGYLAPEVYQAQANEIGAELAKLKDVRQEKFNSKAASMLEEVKKLKMLIFELEEPLEAFDEKLFLEIVKSIQINKEDEMSVEFLGGLRFRERI